MNREELARMLNAYRDGDLTQGEAEHLAALARESTEVSAWMLAELETEGLIAQALEETDSEAFLRGFWERHRAEQDGEHFVHDFEEKRAEENAGRSRRWRIVAAATAAMVVVLVGAMVSAWMQSASGPEVVARVEQVRGEVVLVREGGERRLDSEATLLSGDGLRVSGDESSAAVVFADGTQLEFAEDTVVTSVMEDRVKGKRVLLAEGFFTAHVAKQPEGRPMILTTPHSEVVVLGTTFSLSVGTAVTHLETQSGKVRLKRVSDGKAVEVPAGFNALVATIEEPLVAQPLMPRTGTPRLQVTGCWNGTLSPDAGTLAAMRYVKGDVEIWNAETAQREAAFRAHDKRTTSAAYTPDGQSLITGSLDETLKWWEPSTRELVATVSPGVGEITEVKVTNDGRFLTVLSHAALSEIRKITSWDLATRELRWGPKEFRADRMAFSPDGRMLATARKVDRFVTLWNLEAGETKAVLRESGDQKSGLLRNVLSMAFSHDGRTLAVDDLSGLVSLWDVESGAVRSKFKRLGGRIFGMGFSRDDRFLATGQQDDTVRIWEVSSAKPVAAFAGPARTQVRDITFASDGRTLLTRGIRLATEGRARDGILQLWDLPDTLIPSTTR